MTFVRSVGQVRGPSVRLVEPDQAEGGQAGNGVSGLQLLIPSFPPLPAGMPRPVGHASGSICKVRCLDGMVVAVMTILWLLPEGQQRWCSDC